MAPSSIPKSRLLATALLARGYSECAPKGDPLFAQYRIFKISPTHARILAAGRCMVWISRDSGSARYGNSYTASKPIPKQLKLELYSVGLRIALRPIVDLREIGL